jgi:hypothetical protein
MLKTKLACSLAILMTSGGLSLGLFPNPALAQSKASMAADCKSIGGTFKEYKNTSNRYWCFYYNKKANLYFGLTKSNSLDAWIKVAFRPSKTSNRGIIDGSVCPYAFEFVRRSSLFSGCTDLRGALVDVHEVDPSVKQNDFLFELSEAGKTMTSWLTEKELMSGQF